MAPSFDEFHAITLRPLNQSFDGLLWPLMTDESLVVMLQKEGQHFPEAADYVKRFESGDLDLVARNEAVGWIAKVSQHYRFGHHCAILSVNYLDRFLSVYEMPRGKAWMMQLLAVACLSIACKMEEAEVPLPLDLQVNGPKYVFEAITIRKMELLVLSTLEWRMRAITPFSFINHFIDRINDDELPPPRSSLLRSVELISATAKGIDFLKFKPSEIAAASAILAMKESQIVDLEKAVSILSQYVEKGSVFKCMELILGGPFTGDSNTGGNSSVSKVPRSPTGVLDVGSLSFRNDGLTAPCASSAICAPEFKLSILNGPCAVGL